MSTVSTGARRPVACTLLFAALLFASPAFAQHAEEPGNPGEAFPAESMHDGVGTGPADSEPASEHGNHAAAGHDVGGKHKGAINQNPEASCTEILGEHEEAHGEHDVATVIFHHVSDVHELEFENPFPSEHPGALKVNFKRMLCQATGWNGIVGHVGGMPVDLTPTKHLFWMWISALLLIALFVSAAPKKGTIVPTGMAGLLEMILLFVRDELARKNIGEKEGDRYVPYLATAFFFILMMNMLGLIPYTGTATGNLGVTAGLALLTFFITQGAGIRSAGLGGYLKHLTGGVHWALWPIMIPVEFLGLFTKPFALAVRLFANMVAGHIVIYFLIGLIFIMKTAALAPVSVAFSFAIYLLELFVALVQAFVFTMLSSLFIGMSVAMGHHDHGGHADESGAHGTSHDHAVHH